MTLARTVFLILAFLLLNCVQTFAQSSVSDNAVATGDKIKPLATAQTGTEQEKVEAETDDAGEDIVEPEEGVEEEVIQIADPLYPWNNVMYQFNDKLYFWVMKPVAKGYSHVFPEDIRIAVGNFFYNLITPVRFVSDVLQLKMKNAGNELVRLVYNSTAGVFGLVDAAKTTPRVAQSVLAEANELTAIAASSINTARRNSD